MQLQYLLSHLFIPYFRGLASVVLPCFEIYWVAKGLLYLSVQEGTLDIFHKVLVKIFVDFRLALGRIFLDSLGAVAKFFSEILLGLLSLFFGH